MYHVHVCSLNEFMHYLSMLHDEVHSNFAGTTTIHNYYCCLLTGSDSLLAAIVVSYMLHDPRTKKDHSRVVRLITVSFLHGYVQCLSVSPNDVIHQRSGHPSIFDTGVLACQFSISALIVM